MICATVSFWGMNPGDWVAIFSLISIGGGALYQMFKFVEEMHSMVGEFKEMRQAADRTNTQVNNHTEVLVKHDGEIQEVFDTVGLKRLPSRIKGGN